MKGYWFLSRRLRCKAQSSFSKCNKLINHFSTPPVCDGDLGLPLWGHFIWLQVWCVWGSGLPKMMSWGLLLTPTPALVPAATSTRYCTPACSPPTTTERMVASTDLLTWKWVSLAKHQIWQRQTCQTEFIVSLYITLPVYPVQSLMLPCTPGWCRSVGRWGEGPMTRWWTCCYGSLLSILSLAVEPHQVLKVRRLEKQRKYIRTKKEQKG